jgi:hypothetical protein
MGSDVATVDLADPAGADQSDFEHGDAVPIEGEIRPGICNIFSNCSRKPKERFIGG